MKRYTIQIDFLEGCDEFWESNPSPQEVKDVILEYLENYVDTGCFEINTLKIIRIEDTNEY